MRSVFQGLRVAPQNADSVAGPAHKLRIAGRDILLQRTTAIGTGVAGLLLGQVLQQQGYARKGRLLRETLAQGLRELRVADRVQLAIDAACPLHGRLTDFPGADFAATDQVGQGGGVVSKVFGLLHGGFQFVILVWQMSRV